LSPNPDWRISQLSKWWPNIATWKTDC
jgi:hypothetical protein